MKQQILMVLVLCSWLIPELNLIGEEPESSTGKVYRDNVCGPRAVLHVLRHYGQDASLFDLVKECQWPDFEKGSSMDSLAKALEKRGIYTASLHLKDGLKSDLVWPGPMIATLSTGNMPFHYTTLINASDGTLNCIEDFPIFFSRHHTEYKSYIYLLLTSNKPISQSDIGILIQHQDSLMKLTVLPTVMVIAIVILLLVFAMKRCVLLPARAVIREGVAT